MPDWGIDIIKVLIGGLVGGWITFRGMKWKLRQDRKTDWAKMRGPIYNEGLQFVIDVQQNQTNHEELGHIRTRWNEWFTSKGNSFPPSVFDAILAAINWTTAMYVDLQHDDVDQETRRIFKKELQTAKDFLREHKDIGWLPEDLR